MPYCTAQFQFHSKCSVDLSYCSQNQPDLTLDDVGTLLLFCISAQQAVCVGASRNARNLA
jgi:hypothetical protein